MHRIEIKVERFTDDCCHAALPIHQDSIFACFRNMSQFILKLTNNRRGLGRSLIIPLTAGLLHKSHSGDTDRDLSHWCDLVMTTKHMPGSSSALKKNDARAHTHLETDKKGIEV